MPAVSRKSQSAVETPFDVATKSSEPVRGSSSPSCGSESHARRLQSHLARQVAEAPAVETPGQTVRRVAGAIGMLALSAWVIAAAAVTAVSAILGAIA